MMVHGPVTTQFALEGREEGLGPSSQHGFGQQISGFRISCTLYKDRVAAFL
jgi:hypothetical protein